MGRWRGRGGEEVRRRWGRRGWEMEGEGRKRGRKEGKE